MMGQSIQNGTGEALSVDDLVKAMGAGGMSKSQVSWLCAEIDERVNAFLSGRWKGPGPTSGSMQHT